MARVDAPPASARDVNRTLAGFLHTLGPGLITGAADDDPSGISTYSQAGAAFGYATLSVAVVSFPLMAAVQVMYARVGLVARRRLGERTARARPAPGVLDRVRAVIRGHHAQRRGGPRVAPPALLVALARVALLGATISPDLFGRPASQKAGQAAVRFHVPRAPNAARHGCLNDDLPSPPGRQRDCAERGRVVLAPPAPPTINP